MFQVILGTHRLGHCGGIDAGTKIIGGVIEKFQELEKARSFISGKVKDRPKDCPYCNGYTGTQYNPFYLKIEFSGREKNLAIKTREDEDAKTIFKMKCGCIVIEETVYHYGFSQLNLKHVGCKKHPGGNYPGDSKRLFNAQYNIL